MRWVEISIEATDASVDAVVDILTDAGSGGAVIGSSPGTASCNPARVTSYLPVDDRLETRLNSIRDRIALLPSLGLNLRSEEISVVWLEDQDWATVWKQHFKPVRAGRVIVKPTWEECDAGENDIVVEIDPGMAFGTGYHPTTQLCLLALQDYVKVGDVVLDMGTGSAVLAITSARLGAKKVVALDIDSVAVEDATDNIKQAQLNDIVEIGRADSPLAFDGKADLIVANIIAKALIEMAPELAARMKANGLLIASGIVLERADSVRIAFREAGINVFEERIDGDWVAMIGRLEG